MQMSILLLYHWNKSAKQRNFCEFQKGTQEGFFLLSGKAFA